MRIPLVLLFLISLTLHTKGQRNEIEIPVRQTDNRIHVRLLRQHSSTLFGAFSQDYRVTIQNKTQDKLLVKLQYKAYLTCGKTNTHLIGPFQEGITIQPGQTAGKPYATDGSGTAVRLGDNACPRSKLKNVGKDQTGSKLYSAIQGMAYTLISIENISEKERKEKEKKEREKSAAEKKKKEEAEKLAEKKKQNELKLQKEKQNQKGSRTQTNKDDFWSGTSENGEAEIKKKEEDFWNGSQPQSNSNKNEQNEKMDFWDGASFTHFTIQSPQDNFKTDQGFYKIRGKVKTSEKKLNAMVIGEDYNHPFEISNNNFDITLLLKSGINRFRVKINDHEENITITCTRKPVKLRASLIWNTSGSDIDLYMTDPNGSSCSYQNKVSRNMNLDVDNTKGYGPENIYVNGVTEGTYTIKIQNYSRGEGTSATVYIYVDEKLKDTKTLTFSSNKEFIEVAKLRF